MYAKCVAYSIKKILINSSRIMVSVMYTYFIWKKININNTLFGIIIRV